MNKIKAVSFDLDGTICLGERLIDGAVELITFLKQKRIKPLYFTNNSTKTRKQIFEKLKGLGLETGIDEVYNSAYATARYLREQKIKQVFCVGTAGLVSELRTQGIAVGEERVEAIVIGLDPGFNYSKMAKVLRQFQRGKCRIVACNRDRNYPVDNGVLLPACGPIVSAIEEACGKQADYVVGKPNTYILEILVQEHRLLPDEIVVVGDSYESDIEMARRFDCLSVLVSKSEKKNIEGTMVVGDILEVRGLFI